MSDWRNDLPSTNYSHEYTNAHFALVMKPQENNLHDQGTGIRVFMIPIRGRLSPIQSNPTHPTMLRPS